MAGEAMQYHMEMQKENTGSAGAWNTFAIIQRDVLRPNGVGTAEKVRLHYIIDDRNAVGSSDGAHPFFGTGVLWAAAYQNSGETIGGDSGQVNPAKVLDIKAGQHAGNITLDLKGAKLRQDGFDAVEQDGDIYLWMKNTDTTTDDTLVWRIYIELEGRWVKINPL